MEDEDDFFDNSYKPSGLICEKCGYNDSLKCYIDMPETDDAEPDYILCGKHAAKEGFCCCCGTFCAGMDSFEFQHPGYCDNCYEEVRSNSEDDDDDDYDYIDHPHFI